MKKDDFIPDGSKTVDERLFVVELKVELMASMIRALMDHGVDGARTSAEAQQFKQEMEK